MFVSLHRVAHQTHIQLWTQNGSKQRKALTHSRNPLLSGRLLTQQDTRSALAHQGWPPGRDAAFLSSIRLFCTLDMLVRLALLWPDLLNERRLGTAHSSPAFPAVSRSPLGVPEFRDVSSPYSSHAVFACGAGCRYRLLSDTRLHSKVAASRRDSWRQAGVAVHGGCVSAVLAQLEYTRRGWRSPPLGLLPQNAGQCEGQG
jgi:hypothetical protein